MKKRPLRLYLVQGILKINDFVKNKRVSKNGLASTYTSTQVRIGKRIQLLILALSY